ncbi:hypothetical protein PV326_012622 [Microctonus aethiopoides]|nr:hypothetical protein PV326_012622 [Microctonus aethiopoides]
MTRWSTVFSVVFLALSTVLSLGKLLVLVAGNGNDGDLTDADQWLMEIGLTQYRPLFKKKRLGKNSIFPFLNPVSRVQLDFQNVEQYLIEYCPINKYFISQFNDDNNTVFFITWII